MTPQWVNHIAFRDQCGELVPDRFDDRRWQSRHKHLMGKNEN